MENCKNCTTEEFCKECCEKEYEREQSIISDYSEEELYA
jgi:hypothetical protein